MDKASPTGNESETKGPSHSASSMGETGAESEQPDPDPEIQFTRLKHIQYFANCLRGTLPKAYCKLETNRLTLVHFAVQSLEMLNFFDEPDLVERYEIRKEHIINWIYSLQVVVVQQQGSTSRNDGNAGFKGGTFLGNMSMSMNANANHLLKESCDCDTKTSSGTCSSVDTESCSGSGSGSSSNSCYKELKYDTGHLAMNYTALCTLITLGDDLERVDRRGMIQSLKQLQLPDGSFQSIPLGSENDLRFLYCACAISHILDDWSGINKDMAVSYIRSCRSWDGGIGLIEGQEGHGGSTFCGVAALSLMGELDDVLDDGDGDIDDDDDIVDASLGPYRCKRISWRHELIRWCVSRQISGMQGRPNKVEDTCYSYWVGGALKILKCDHLLDHDALRQFVMCCQTDMGGFSKLKATGYPDLLHSFYSMAWLSLSQNCSGDPKEDSGDLSQRDGIASYYKCKLNPLDCVLGMSRQKLEAYYR